MSSFISTSSSTQTQEENEGDFSDRRNTFSEHPLKASNLVMVTMFLDPEVWAELSLTLEEQRVLKRPGDDISLPKAKKPRTEIHSVRGSTSASASQIHSEGVEKLVKLIRSALVVPKSTSTTVPDLSVMKETSIQEFLQGVNEIPTPMKEFTQLINRIEELKQGMYFWYYRYKGIGEVKPFLKENAKIKDKGASMKHLGEALKNPTSDRRIKAGLTTMLVNDLVRQDSEDRLLIYNTENQKELENCWTFMNRKLKKHHGDDFLKAYKNEVESLKMYSDIIKAIKETRDKINRPSNTESEE